MTFAEFYAQIALSVFPEGEAENLQFKHKLAVKDALIDLQQKVPCLRTDQKEYVGQSSTSFHCGASVFDTVDGNIERVSTVALTSGCDEVDYTWIDYERMRKLMHEYKCCRCTTASGMNPYTAGDLPGPLEFPVADDTMDKGSRTGSRGAYWSLYRGQIYVFPSIESTEEIVVDWTGIRRTFDESTVISDTLTDRKVMQSVESYLDAEVHRWETKDTSSYSVAKNAYADMVGVIIWECRQKMNPIRPLKLQAPNAC